MIGLKPEEQMQIFHWYHNAPKENGKLVLKIVKHMSLHDTAMLCAVLDSVPFKRTTGDNWTLERADGTSILRFKPYAFHIDHDTCNVNLHLDGRLSNVGSHGQVTQFLLKNNYAIPIFFDRGNEHNGKTPFELGIAIPNQIHLKDALNILYDKDKSMIDEWLFDKKCHDIDLTNIAIYEQQLTEINKSIIAKR